MIEVEVKVAVKNRLQIENSLQQLGFEKGDLLKESDYYFDSKFNKLREQDMALRIRSCENLTSNTAEHFMTFKGPKLDSISMTRKELETKIESAETGIEILCSLGYEPILPVHKLRQHLAMGEITACLDQVEELGDFLELEIIVQQESEREAALNQIITLLNELGYAPTEIIRTSYLSMLQRKSGWRVVKHRPCC